MPAAVFTGPASVVLEELVQKLRRAGLASSVEEKQLWYGRLARIVLRYPVQMIEVEETPSGPVLVVERTKRPSRRIRVRLPRFVEAVIEARPVPAGSSVYSELGAGSDETILSRLRGYSVIEIEASDEENKLYIKPAA